VRDEKMLEKLATHDVQDVSDLFSQEDKCARAAEGRAWHSQSVLEAGKVGTPKIDATAQNSGRNRNRNRNRKKKKAGGNNNNKPLGGAPTTTAATVVASRGHGPRGDKQPRQPSISDEAGLQCPMHNSRHNTVEECWEIKKLTEQLCEQQK
jgi:hypothetical protein